MNEEYGDDDIHVDIYDGDGPPLLLVHGFLSSRAQWLANLNALKCVSTPVVVELLGHGRAGSPRDLDRYHPANYVRCFDQIRERLGVDRWSVLGCSLGAGLTMRYAFEHPHRVFCHMMTNSSSGFADGGMQARFRVDPAATVARFEAGGLAAVTEIPVHPRFARRLPPEVLTPLLADCAVLSPAGVGRTLAVTNANASVRDRLGENVRPAMLLCGRFEKRFQPLRDHAEAAMPHLTICDLDAGHAVNGECIDGFNAAVTGFLRQHAPA